MTDHDKFVEHSAEVEVQPGGSIHFVLGNPDTEVLEVDYGPIGFLDRVRTDERFSENPELKVAYKLDQAHEMEIEDFEPVYDNLEQDIYDEFAWVKVKEDNDYAGWFSKITGGATENEVELTHEEGPPKVETISHYDDRI